MIYQPIVFTKPKNFILYNHLFNMGLWMKFVSLHYFIVSAFSFYFINLFFQNIIASNYLQKLNIKLGIYEGSLSSEFWKKSFQNQSSILNYLVTSFLIYVRPIDNLYWTNLYPNSFGWCWCLLVVGPPQGNRFTTKLNGIKDTNSLCYACSLTPG